MVRLVAAICVIAFLSGCGGNYFQKDPDPAGKWLLGHVDSVF